MKPALTIINEVQQIAPNEVDTHNLLADYYFKSGKVDLALNASRDALRIDAENIEANVMMGNIYLRKKKPKITFFLAFGGSSILCSVRCRI